MRVMSSSACVMASRIAQYSSFSSSGCDPYQENTEKAFIRLISAAKQFEFTSIQCAMRDIDHITNFYAVVLQFASQI